MKQGTMSLRATNGPLPSHSANEDVPTVMLGLGGAAQDDVADDLLDDDLGEFNGIANGYQQLIERDGYVTFDSSVGALDVVENGAENGTATEDFVETPLALDQIDPIDLPAVDVSDDAAELDVY